jgi:hypothetical protein
MVLEPTVAFIVKCTAPGLLGTRTLANDTRFTESPPALPFHFTGVPITFPFSVNSITTFAATLTVVV